jgi:peptidoglycan-associated lipoprotein
MRSSVRPTAVVLTVILTVLLGACKSTPPPAPLPEPTPVPTPVPTPMVQEQDVREPVTETIVSEEVTEELPEDLEILNARGYLKDAFFETDRWDIRPEYRETLTRNAAWLQRYPTVKVLIEGHCDERNTREYNLALGERRANAVRDYLVFLGVSPGRLSTISYGEERPFALGHTEEAWQLNRRAHFVITNR